MSRFTWLICIFILPASYTLRGQTSKKQSTQYFRAIGHLDISEIKNGYHLEYAQLYPVKQFFEYMAEYGKTNMSKKLDMTTIEQVYRDSASTYFVRATVFEPVNFFRVKNEELENLNYSDFDGNAVRGKFMAEVIPASDKQRVEKEEEKPAMGFYRADFKYNYHPETRLLEITYRWKVSSDFKRVIKRTYHAKYDINAKRFIDISMR